MRLFVGVELPDEVKSRLKGWLGQPKARDWRWTPLEQWHVTLAFLGDVEGASVERLGASLSDLRFEPFSLSLGSPGGFPDERHAKVAWVGLHGDLLPLGKLHQAVSIACGNFAPQMDTKPFHPHVTIGRSKLAYGLPLPLPHSAPVGHWTCSEFRLFKSTLGRDGSIHETVQCFPASS